MNINCDIFQRPHISTHIKEKLSLVAHVLMGPSTPPPSLDARATSSWQSNFPLFTDCLVEETINLMAVGFSAGMSRIRGFFLPPPLD